MKTIQNVGLVLLCVSCTISCKKIEEMPNNNSATEAVVESVHTIAKPKNDTILNKNQKSYTNNIKFIRTADVKFKVKDVSKSTYSIENSVNKFGGYVTNTDLKSNILEKDEIKISQDSAIIVTKFFVENNITIRLPNTKLDTLIKTIAKQIDFLDYRIIKSDDVSLQILSNELEQNRSKNHETRLAAAIDKKGKKLNDIVLAEDDLTNKKEKFDDSRLENLSLNDQVNFSTLSLQLYQRETIAQEKVANTTAIRPNIGSQIIDSLATGWYLLENIIAFIAQLWSLILIGFLAWFSYRKFKNKSISL